MFICFNFLTGQSTRGLSIKGDLVDDVFSPNPGSPSVRKPDERTKTKTDSEDSVTSIDPTPLKDFVQVTKLGHPQPSSLTPCVKGGGQNP